MTKLAPKKRGRPPNTEPMAKIEIRCTEEQKARWLAATRTAEHGDLSKAVRKYLDTL